MCAARQALSPITKPNSCASRNKPRVRGDAIRISPHVYNDGTLVLLSDQPSPGTNLTVEEANALGRALLLVDLSAYPEGGDVLGWVAANGIQVLNVAGPRESEAPGVYKPARTYLEDIFGQDR